MIVRTLLIVVLTLVQYSTPGDAFVKKLLEARLMASMMKELNNPQQYQQSKYMPYFVPMPKMQPMETYPMTTSMSAPWMTRMKMMSSMMKSPMDTPQVEHMIQHYSAAHFDHSDHHHFNHEDTDNGEHHFDGHHHDLAHFDLPDQEMHKMPAMNNMKTNGQSMAAMMKMASLKAKPWNVPSRDPVKANTDFSEDFPMSGFGQMSRGLKMGAVNSGMDNVGDPFNMKYLKMSNMMGVNTDSASVDMKNLDALVEKMKELNKNEDMSEISDSQMKHLIMQNMEKSSEDNDNQETENNEPLEEMKPVDMDKMNIMKPFDVVKGSKTVTRFPPKSKTNENREKTTSRPEITSPPEDNRGSPYIGSNRDMSMLMSLPRYPTPVPKLPFTLKLPTSQASSNEANQQGLMGRMRTAMGNLGLGGTRRPSWNQLSGNSMSKFHEMSQTMPGQGYNFDNFKMTPRPLIMPPNPLNAMGLYNSMPTYSLGMHPAMEAMFFSGLGPHNMGGLRAKPKEGLPAYLGSIQQNSSQDRVKPHSAESDRFPQHQQLRSQMDKIMNEVTRRPSRPRQNPYSPKKTLDELPRSNESSVPAEWTTTEPAISNLVDLKLVDKDLQRLPKDRMDVAENQVSSRTSPETVIALEKLDSESVTAETSTNSTAAAS